MVVVPMPHVPTVGGLPIRLAVDAFIRQARAANAARAAADPPSPAAPVPLPAPAGLPHPACPHLAAVLRGFSLAELRVEALARAQEAAIEREHIEGFTVGRSYGDPDLRGLEPSVYLARFLPEAVARAERAGAIADLLFHLIGQERALEAALVEGAGV